MTSHVHEEIPILNRWLASLLYVLQYAFPGARRLENVRQWNARIIREKVSKKLGKEGRVAGRVLSIDRRRNLSEREFVSEYLNKSVPVIFDGQAADWKCAAKWNLDFFAERFGDKKISLNESRGMVEPDMDRTGGADGWVVVEQMQAKDFVSGIRSGSKNYLRFCSLTNHEAELVADMDTGWLSKMRRTFLNVNYLAFIGAGGRRTPIHAGISAFFFICAEGEKKWTLFSPACSALINPRRDGRDYNFSDVNISNPDLEKYPGFDLLNRHECVMKKGDILFVPTWWWHEVENLSETFGIRYGFGNFRTFLRFPSFVFVRLFLCEPSFFKILYHKIFAGASRKPSLIHNRLFTD